MATGDAAWVAAKLKDDNRTVVASKVKGAATIVMATSVGPDGTALTNNADTPAALTAETTTSAAYIGGLASDNTAAAVKGRTLVVPIIGPLDKTNLRTQYFTVDGTYDSSKVAFGAKRCYVNINGRPLDANGAPTTVALAINAETTALSKVGEAVSNGRQVYVTKDSERAPWPGKYESHPFQTSYYAPYAKWTVQHDIPTA